MSDTLEAVLELETSSGLVETNCGGENPESRLAVAVTRQFVTFQMENETFAVPLTEVQEIIRLPDIVEVPMSQANLKGLANLRGTVLPIINLRHIFHMQDMVHDDATRVVVINTGKPVGFVVDRMARVVTVEPKEIESIHGIESTVDTDLLEGIIKRAQTMIMILDTSKLTVTKVSKQTGRKIGSDNEQAAAAVDRKNSASDEIQLVSFELDRQEYALPIESVQEIVQVPETVNSIPNSQGHVLGVMNLRNRLLPLVSLRSIFGMPQTSVGDQSRIVVVAHKINGEEHAVGLVTDTVKEVLRIQRSIVDPLPALMSPGSAVREVDQICRMEGGKRLVSILRPDRLFLNASIAEAIDETTNSDKANPMNSSTASMSEQADEEEQFVVFRVADEEYGVPIEAVQEIIRIPDQLTRVPKAPSFVEGVVNLRGSVLPVIDQRRRFSLPEIPHNDRQRIMVFTIQGVRTGFIVDSVSEVLKISMSQISPAPDVAMHERSAVARVANIVDLKRMILMLDVDQLLSKTESKALTKVG